MAQSFAPQSSLDAGVNLGGTPIPRRIAYHLCMSDSARPVFASWPTGRSTPSGRYVLYWMIANRRTRWNFSLDRAVEWATRLGRPLLIFEPFRIDHPWACDRFHQFVLDGMADTRRALEGRPGVELPALHRTRPGAGKGLLAALAADAVGGGDRRLPGLHAPADGPGRRRTGRCAVRGRRRQRPRCRCACRRRRFQRRTRFVDSFNATCRRTSAIGRCPIH